MLRKCKNERGVTLPLMAISLIVILGMAALAIDVVTLYGARTEAQRAADAAALAGARAIVGTGFTSSVALTATDVCSSSGNTGVANQQAIQAAMQNTIAGVPASVQSISCNLANVQNPTITVTIQRTGLPTFFSRIWGNAGNSVTASATAEAYNPSGQTTAPPISVASVKPFLMPNCDPNGGPVFMCNPGFFFDATNSNAVNTANNYIDTNLYKVQQGSASGGASANRYLVADTTLAQWQANGCPASSRLPANSCSSAGGGGLYDSIACADTHVISCGDRINVDILGSGVSPDTTDASGGVQCLIHSAAQTSLTAVCNSPNTTIDQDCFVPGPPATIQGGIANPNPALISQANISRSDSVITVPVFDSTTNPCPPAATCGPVTVIGFLQLGIQDVANDGSFHAYVLNAAGCGSNGTNGITAGGVSPIPVRLIHN